jgi:hypothetical protein
MSLASGAGPSPARPKRSGPAQGERANHHDAEMPPFTLPYCHNAETEDMCVMANFEIT